MFGYVAAEADVCVLLLRHRPRLRGLMVRWDLSKDTFEVGQWVKATFYESECGLSADGSLFMYHAVSYGRRPDPIPAYTAVCRPPYFTALALWKTVFDSTPYLYSPWSNDDPPQLRPPDLGAIPESCRSKIPNPHSDGRNERRDAPAAPEEREAYGDWSGTDHRGRRLLVRAGRIHVREGLNDERELIDLNPLRYKPIPPPEWATKWPE